MKTVIKLSKDYAISSVFLTLILFSLVIPVPAFGAEVGEYCLVPPYVKRDIQPNILVLFDNSSEMKNAAYDINNDGFLDPLDPEEAYDPSETYDGYFYPDLYYTYSGSGNGFVPDAAGIFRGNLLNWATTSRFDLLQKILADGKTTSEVGPNSKHLHSESNSWTAEYSGCIFEIASNTLVVKDKTASSCILLNPARLGASLEIAPVAQSSKAGTNNYAVNLNVSKEKQKYVSLKSEKNNKGFVFGLLKGLFGKVMLLGNNLMDLMSTEAYAAPLAIKNNPSPGNGTVCVNYLVELSAQGGTGGYTWSISAGSLPAGLSICPGTASCGGYTAGSIYGIPTTAGNYNFTVRLTDSGGTTVTKAYAVTIGPAGAISISTAAALIDATSLAPYSVTLAASGGCAPYAWSITSDPDSLFSGGGFTLNAGTGEISSASVLKAPGTYSFTARVDGGGVFATKTFTLTVKVASALRESTGMNVKICRGDYVNNCAVGTPPVKAGILQLFADQSRIGLEQFNKTTGAPEIPSGTCISPSQSSNFFTQVLNVQPYPGDTSLVNAMSYFSSNTEDATGAIAYYMNNTTNNCNPFRNSSPCMKNTVLMITDGKGAATGTNVYSDPTNCTSTYDLVKNTCYAHKDDLRHPTDSSKALTGKQVVSTYIVGMMGTHTCGSVACNDILEAAANAGDGTFYPVTDPATLKANLIQAFKDIIKRAAAGTAASVLASGEGSGANLIQAVFYPSKKFEVPLDPTATKEILWTGRLSNFWYYVDPFFGASSIREDSNSDKVLNLADDYVATFYYDSSDEQTEAELLQDTDADGFGNTNACRYGPRPGQSYTCDNPSKAFENLLPLWEAGRKLWSRTTARTIFTTFDVTNVNGFKDKVTFDTTLSNVQALKPYFGLPTTDGTDLDLDLDGDLDKDGDVDDADAEILVRYIQGEDNSIYTWLRSRTVTIPEVDNTPRVWKLGDILHSTPKIASWRQLNTFDSRYKDYSYGAYIDSSIYKGRNLVFAGGNDGMLHAFKLGLLGTYKGTSPGSLGKACSNDSTRACRTDGDCASPGTCGAPDTAIGDEVWAFIPKNVLPYLRYIPQPDYCHIYSVDLAPYVFDASIGSTTNAGDVGCTAANYWNCSKYDDGGVVLSPVTDRWRTILIGGMRYGGGCRASTAACADVSGDGDPDCVKNPGVIVGGADIGYSTYFALDITEQNDPKILWEFSDPRLGFTTTGPALIRIAPKTGDSNGDSVIDGKDSPDNNKNGRWFVVLGSGPTGPISTTDQQFMGRSDQGLNFFVLDLKTGVLQRQFDDTDINISNAFAGSMLDSNDDTNLDYQDEAIYVPYVQRAGSSPNYTWTAGGVGRILTHGELDPDDWTWGSVISGIGPVTSSVARLQSPRTGYLWLYFGEGRYFYESSSATSSVDDGDSTRTLYGIIDPCFSGGSFIDGCTTTRTSASLDPINLTSDAGVTTTTGWKITLDSCTAADGLTPVNCITGTPAFRAERVITDPLTTTTGVVYFTTYKPYNDVCAFGGQSYIWALKYDTGAAPGSLLKGMALMQVSTGSIEQLDLGDAFTQKSGRRTGALEGVPPTAQGLSILSTPPPTKRVIHMRER